jgi:hypothetical protein
MFFFPCHANSCCCFFKYWRYITTVVAPKRIQIYLWSISDICTTMRLHTKHALWPRIIVSPTPLFPVRLLSVPHILIQPTWKKCKSRNALQSSISQEMGDHPCWGGWKMFPEVDRSPYKCIQVKGRDEETSKRVKD